MPYFIHSEEGKECGSVVMMGLRTGNVLPTGSLTDHLTDRVSTLFKIYTRSRRRRRGGGWFASFHGCCTGTEHAAVSAEQEESINIMNSSKGSRGALIRSRFNRTFWAINGIQLFHPFPYRRVGKNKQFGVAT